MEVVEAIVEVEDSFGEKTDDSSKGTRGGTITRCQYEVFVNYLRTNAKPKQSELKEADLIDDLTIKYSKSGYGVTGRFLAWAKRMTLHESDDVLFFKNTGKEILCREDFETSIREANKTTAGSHYSFIVTLKRLREKYTMGKRQFGMSEDFVREVLMTCTNPDCPCKKVKKLPRDDLAEKTLRGTKSCSSLSDKSYSDKTPPGKHFLPNSRTSSEKKRKTRIKNASAGSVIKPPVAYYALLDLSSIRSKQLAARNLHQGSSNMLSVSSEDPNCIIGEPKVGKITDSVQTTSTAFNSAILAQLSKCIPTASTSQKTGNKRPVYYKLYSNPAADSGQNISLASSSGTLQAQYNESQQLIGQPSNDKGQPDVIVISPTKVNPFLPGPRSSVNPLELFDRFSPLSMFADSPGGNPEIAATLNKSSKPNDQRASSSKSPRKAHFPSFNLPCPAKLPYSDLWYFHHDIHCESNRYKKLVNVINDMSIDLKQSFMGSKPAAERLRKKIVVAESLVNQCKEITSARMKIASERGKAKKLAVKKSNEKTLKKTDTGTVISDNTIAKTEPEVIIIDDNNEVNNNTVINIQ